MTNDGHMKKKIVFTVTNDLSYDQRMIRICSSLGEAYRVILVGRIKRESIPLVPRRFEQKRLRCIFQRGKLFYLEYNIRLFLFLLFTPFDLVGAVDLDTIFPALLVSRLKGQKCIFDAHEYFSEVPEVVDRPIVKRIWELLAFLCIPRMHGCYTVSQSLAEIFERKYEKKFDLIRNLPSERTDLAPTDDGSDRKILLYQGVLNAGRGLEPLIRAIDKLEGMILWLVGEGDLSSDLRELVLQKQMGTKVKFLGYQSPEDLRQLTVQADIGFNLLENKGESYYYSLANKFFDYIQAELPSVNMNFPEYSRINKQFEVSVLLNDLEEKSIINAIVRLRDDQILYQRLKDNCREAKRLLNWEREQGKLLAIYQKVTNAS